MPAVTRADRIAATLLRPEALAIIRALEHQDLHLLLESPRYLHTFADLVAEDLISVEQKQLFVTPVAERYMEEIANWEYV